MSITSLKTWHWMVIGLAVGVAFAAVRVQTGASTPLNTDPGLHIQQFASILSAWTPTGKPYFRNLALYPPLDGKMFVTGEIPRDRAKPDGEHRPFQLNTPIPFKLPFGTDAPSDAYTLRDHIAQHHPDLGYTYAWWASDRAQYLIWSTVSTVLIGLAWPLVLRLLVGAGYGRATADPAYDLDRFAHEPSPATTAAAPADPAALEALNRSLEQQLGPSATPTGAPAVHATSTAAVPALSGSSLEPSAPDSPADPKDYKGEFYPVAVPAPHPADDQQESLPNTP
jgi:hypothetical protein